MKKIFFIVVIAVVFSCTNSEEVKPSQITNQEIISVGEFSLSVKCDILIDKSQIMDFGLVYSESSNVTVDNSQKASYKESSDFLSRSSSVIVFSIKGLQKSVQYYVNVYVTLSDGSIVYGEEKSITTMSGNRFFLKSHSVPEDNYILFEQKEGICIDEKMYYIYFGSLYYDDYKFGNFKELVDLQMHTNFMTHINSKLYFIGGKKIVEFDLSTNKLVEKMECPVDFSSYATGFTIGDKIYVGSSSFWVFDPNDMKNGTDQNGNTLGSWNRIASKSDGFMNKHEEISFSFNNYGYSWFEKELHRYDKDKDSWTIVTKYPGDTFGDLNDWFAFCIDGVFYTNSGSFQDKEGEIWSYDILKDSWKLITPENKDLIDLDKKSNEEWQTFFVQDGQVFMFSNELHSYVVFVP